MLQPIRRLADQVVDTSALTVHELRRRDPRIAGAARRAARRSSSRVLSFGFRGGVPPDADLVFDVRFLPNPHFVTSLRRWSGRNARVARYVLRSPAARRFLTLTDDAAAVPAAAVHRGREDLPHDRDWLHRRPAPVRGDGRSAGAKRLQPRQGHPACASGIATSREE